MAMIKLGSVSAITDDTSTTLTFPAGAWESANFFVDITAITGTWEFFVRLHYGNSAAHIDNIAFLGTQTTTGMKHLSLQPDYAETRKAIPMPTLLTWNNQVAGSLTADLYGFFA